MLDPSSSETNLGLNFDIIYPSSPTFSTSSLIKSSYSSMPSLISDSIYETPHSILFDEDSLSAVTKCTNFSCPFLIWTYTSQIPLPPIEFFERLQRTENFILPIYFPITEIFLTVKATIYYDSELPSYVYLKPDLVFQNIPPILNVYFHFPEICLQWEDWISLRRG